MKAASGVKKFLTTRLGRIKQVFQKDRAEGNGKDNEAYLVESDDKHPYIFEKVGDKWFRHHKMPRQTLFRPRGSACGPNLDELSDVRVTELIFPDGRTERMIDTWNGDDQINHVTTGMWRGTTTFFRESSFHTKLYFS